MSSDTTAELEEVEEVEEDPYSMDTFKVGYFGTKKVPRGPITKKNLATLGLLTFQRTKLLNLVFTPTNRLTFLILKTTLVHSPVSAPSTTTKRNNFTFQVTRVISSTIIPQTELTSFVIWYLTLQQHVVFTEDPLINYFTLQVLIT
jgi:hypothetical protein